MTRCVACSAEWSGANTAHCPACHTTFTGITAFDKHRDRRGEHGSCIDVAIAGLALTDRKYTCYGLPGERPVQDED